MTQGEFGEPRQTIHEMANNTMYCGEIEILNEMPGCGARNWRAFAVPFLDYEAGLRVCVCQECGAETVAQFIVSDETLALSEPPDQRLYRSL